jgi:hypothetical protein
VSIIVLKPGPARWVDPGPGRTGPETGSSLSKNPLRSWPGETRSTQRVDPEPDRPGQTRLRPDYLPLFVFYRFKRLSVETEKTISKQKRRDTKDIIFFVFNDWGKQMPPEFWDKEKIFS